MRYLLLFLLYAIWPCQAQQPYKQAMKLMGSRFEITVVAKSQAEANTYIDMAATEIRRIESLISSWDPESRTSEVNRNAGVAPVQVAPELFALIQRAIGLSRLTDGAFDISYASMDRIWTFDGSMTEMPSGESISKSVALVGYQKIVLNPHATAVFLPEKGMKIGFGGIGKGYAADRARSLLKENGVEAGIINASGDISAWGRQPGGNPWQVAITNPMDKTKSYGRLALEERAVVTSGDYEKFVRFGGKRYAHIIDPRTGYPATGILSVTVLAPKAEMADALATAVFVMGIEAGLDRLEQLPAVEGIIVDETGALHTTSNVELTPYP